MILQIGMHVRFRERLDMRATVIALNPDGETGFIRIDLPISIAGIPNRIFQAITQRIYFHVSEIEEIVD